MSKAIKILIIMCFALVVAQAGLIGNYFHSDKHSFSLAGEHNWQAQLGKRKHIIKFISESGSWVGVTVVAREEKMRTARDVAKDFNEVYDGWVYKAGRVSWRHEISNANVSDGYIVMYNKNRISEGLRYKDIIVEAYFIKGPKVYVITGRTRDTSWSSDGDKLKRIMDSFRVD